jgi:uncharacterized membrane protein
MDVLVLRLIHIGAGAFWVGSVFSFFLIVQPAAMAAGPSATGFTYRLLHHQRFSQVVLSSGIITVLAGITLLVLTSDGLDPDVLFSASRVGFTIGGVIAILTLAVGGGYVYPRTRQVEGTIGAFVTEGRGPSPEEQQRLGRLSRESRAAGWIVLVGLALAVACMATASYWSLFL